MWASSRYSVSLVLRIHIQPIQLALEQCPQLVSRSLLPIKMSSKSLSARFSRNQSSKSSRVPEFESRNPARLSEASIQGPKLCSLTWRSQSHHCTTCSRLFQSQEALESHFTYSKRHNWCSRCKRHFVSPAAIYEHLQNSQRHWICDYHDFDFPTESALKEHYRDSHIFCDRCARFFSSITAREEHYEKSRSHWICKTHDLDYSTCKELYQHYETDPSHFWCPSCSKHYDTSVQLRNVGQDFPKAART